MEFQRFFKCIRTSYWHSKMHHIKILSILNRKKKSLQDGIIRTRRRNSKKKKSTKITRFYYEKKKHRKKISSSYESVLLEDVSVKGISRQQRMPLMALRCRYIKLIGRPFKRNRLIHNKKLRMYLYLLHVTSLKKKKLLYFFFFFCVLLFHLFFRWCI